MGSGVTNDPGLMKKLIPIVILVSISAVVVTWRLARSKDEFFTRDAVQVITLSVSDAFAGNPGATPEAIDAIIRDLHDASVIHVLIDSEGRPIDLFGTAMQVEFERQEGSHITTVTSAGPDRRFGTADDIQYVHTKDGK